MAKRWIDRVREAWQRSNKLVLKKVEEEKYERLVKCSLNMQLEKNSMHLGGGI